MYIIVYFIATKLLIIIDYYKIINYLFIYLHSFKLKK